MLKIHTEMHVVLHVKCLLSNFTHVGMRRQILIQFTSITFHVHFADYEILHAEGYSRANFRNISMQSCQRMADNV